MNESTMVYRVRATDKQFDRLGNSFTLEAPGGARTFRRELRRKGEVVVAARLEHDVALTDNQADGLRQDGYEVVGPADLVKRLNNDDEDDAA